ncbi:MAG TPA: hypothetical protein VHE35_15320 [Kofleriaceae bacterium]|nr:hypothetical protein [Kofleriaceae bacterium]
MEAAIARVVQETTMKSLSLATLLAATSLAAAGGTAHAAPVDGVVIDPSIGPQGLVYHSASSPNNNVNVPIVFTPPTRDAFTKAQPLMLPCDVSFLAIGPTWKNVSSQPLYVSWMGAVYLNGDEHDQLPDAFGRTMPPIADGRLWQPGQTGNGGFIYLIEPPLISWVSFPANVPLRLQMQVAGYTSGAIDQSTGGYQAANLFHEDIVWNNAYRVWVERTCP